MRHSFLSRYSSIPSMNFFDICNVHILCSLFQFASEHLICLCYHKWVFFFLNFGVFFPSWTSSLAISKIIICAVLVSIFMKICYLYRCKLTSTPWFQFVDACLDLAKESASFSKCSMHRRKNIFIVVQSSVYEITYC